MINNELGADFDPDRFEHVALWNEDERWIEMRLRSTADQVVQVARPRTEVVTFAEGEDLLTEISAKFTPEQLAGELTAADFVVDGMWGADEGEFLLTLAHPYC